MARPTRIKRVSQEFIDVVDTIKEENGLDFVATTRVIAKKLEKRSAKMGWDII